MKTQTLRVSLGFGRESDGTLANSAETVLADLYGKPAFPSPPVTSVQLQDGIGSFSNAMALMANGGPAATANKNNYRMALITLMKDLAFYVQMASNNDLATLLSSGFQAVSTNRTSETLPPPEYVTVKNGQSRQSLATAKAVRNARGYEAQYAPVDDAGTSGEWISVPFTTSSRNIPVDGLASGRIYIYRVRAMGGLTGHSDWSESVSHRAY